MARLIGFLLSVDMANKEQHVGIDFKGSTIAINGTTTASKYLGTDSSGDLEWKDGTTGGANVTDVSVTLGLLNSVFSTNVTLTLSNGTTIGSNDTQDLSGMPCPDDCPDST